MNIESASPIMVATNQHSWLMIGSEQEYLRREIEKRDEHTVYQLCIYFIRPSERPTLAEVRDGLEILIEISV